MSHNHAPGGTPTYPTYRDRCPEGCDDAVAERGHFELKQRLAAPGRYYGDGGTIHGSGTIDIDVVGGKVVAVWFRCMTLPFTVSGDRPSGPRTAIQPDGRITGIEYVDGTTSR